MSPILAIILAAAGLIAAITLLWKTGEQLLVLIKKGNDVADTLIGREAIFHPETGKELVPASPGIGARMVRLEDAFLTLASQDERISSLEHNTRDTRREHSERIKRLEEAAVERVAGHIDSAAAWRAVEAVANTDPPEPPAV